MVSLYTLRSLAVPRDVASDDADGEATATLCASPDSLQILLNEGGGAGMGQGGGGDVGGGGSGGDESESIRKLKLQVMMRWLCDSVPPSEHSMDQQRS